MTNYYSPEGALLEFGEADCPPQTNASIKLPDNLNEMVALAEVLSQDTPFLRVDFYNINSNVYFGELTFYPASGFGRFSPCEWNTKIGNMIKI